MRSTLRNLWLLVPGLSVAGLQDLASPALQWPASHSLVCDRSGSVDPLRTSQQIRSFDPQGRPLDLLETALERGLWTDTSDRSIEWHPDLPIETWWKTGQPYSFPARVIARHVNPSGFQWKDTLTSVWDPKTRTLVYTSESPLAYHVCGWTDSIVFDSLLRRETQTTCQPGSWGSTRKTTRYRYEGTGRSPVWFVTRWDSSAYDMDSAWQEGPAGKPTKESIHSVSKPPELAGRMFVRMQVSQFQYDAQGRMIQVSTFDYPEGEFSHGSQTRFTLADNGFRKRSEGWEVSLGLTRDSLWWSASCTDDPSGVRLAPRTTTSAPAHLALHDGIWHLVSHEPVAGPVEWISARGTRRVVATPTSESVVRLDLPRGAGPGWIRFATRAGARTLPAPVFAP